MYNSPTKFCDRIMMTAGALLIYASASVAVQAQNVGAGVSLGGAGTAGGGISASPTGGPSGGAGAATPQANGIAAGLGFGAPTGQDAGAGAGLGAGENTVGAGIGLPGNAIPGNALPGAPAAVPTPGAVSPTLVSQFNSLDAADRIAIKRRCSELVASPSRRDSQLVALCRLVGK